MNCRKENQESKYLYHLFFIYYHNYYCIVFIVTDCMEYNCSEDKFKEFLGRNGINPSSIQPKKESLWKLLLPK